MTGTSNGGMAERLERLERENAALAKRVRAHRRVVVAALLGVAALALGGAQDQQADLVAGRLSIVDPAGKTRITLGITDKDYASVLIFDNEGDNHVELSVDPRGNVTQLSMYDISATRKNQYYINGDEAGLVVNGQAR